MYQMPWLPDRDPNWPFGYPIWPEPSISPIFPQNWDFFVTIKDKTCPAWIPIAANDPNPRIDWAHPMLPPPMYTYAIPNNFYPMFPVEHWPDNPFELKWYTGATIQDIRPIQKTPPAQKIRPLDPRLRWPQNPFWNWPESKYFVYPEDNRFIWPQNDQDPAWFYSPCPLQDPRWRIPVDTTTIQIPIPQRRPEDPADIDVSCVCAKSQ